MSKKKSKSTNGNTQTKKPQLSAGKRQLEIRGAERPSDKTLDLLVAPFVDARYERMRLEQEERRLHDEVLARMGELKYPSYRYQDGDAIYDLEAVHVDAKDRVKVKRQEVDGA